MQDLMKKVMKKVEECREDGYLIGVDEETIKKATNNLITDMYNNDIEVFLDNLENDTTCTIADIEYMVNVSK